MDPAVEYQSYLSIFDGIFIIFPTYVIFIIHLTCYKQRIMRNTGEFYFNRSIYRYHSIRSKCYHLNTYHFLAVIHSEILNQNGGYLNKR